MRAVNLIPSESRSGRSAAPGRSGGVAYAVVAAIGGLAVLALLYGMAHHQVSSRSAEAASLSTRAQDAQAQAAKLAPYTSFATMRQQRAQAVSELVDARFDWAHAFHELGRVLPKDATISSLEGTVGSTTGSTAAPSAGAKAAAAASTPSTTASSSATAAATTTASSATPPGSVPNFSLSGCATSQQEVALTLQRLRLIDGVTDVSLKSSTKAGTGGSSSAAGTCPGSDPAFSVQVTFTALPSSSAIKSETKLASENGAGR